MKNKVTVSLCSLSDFRKSRTCVIDASIRSNQTISIKKEKRSCLSSVYPFNPDCDRYYVAKHKLK